MSAVGEAQATGAPPTFPDGSPGSSPGGSRGSGRRGRGRSLLLRHRSSVVIALVLLATALVVVLFGAGARTTRPLDPDNPNPDGARALARVLADAGVDIDVVRDADAFDAAQVDDATTVLVTTPEYLGTSTVARLLAHAGDARLVVAGAGAGTVRALGSSALPTQVDATDGLDADCDDPLVSGRRLQVDDAAAYDGPGCFGSDGSAVLRDDTGAGDSAVTLFGAEQALTNDQILRADNAAVALRLLGQEPRLVWYVPSVDDLLAADGTSVETLLPRWLEPGLLLGALAVIALVVWRSRRLGPLATEPLPVVVKAIETTRSRGRLYRRAGDRGHAARALRSAARTRAAERLRLGSRIPPDVVVREVARQLGRPVDEIDALLGAAAPTPPDDHALITLANDLAALEREVRRP